MSEFDFDKEFADDLGKERLFEPTDTGWEKVATDLDILAARKRRRRRLFFWALPLGASAAFAFLGMALLNAYTQVRTMQAEIAQLKTEVATKNRVALSDTVTQHYSVVRYDTIYRTVVMQRLLPDGSDGYAAQKSGGPAGQSELQQTDSRNAQFNQSDRTDNRAQIETGIAANSKTGAPIADSIEATRAGQVESALPERPLTGGSDRQQANSVVARQHNLVALHALAGIPLPVLEKQDPQHLPDMGLLLIPAPSESRHDKLIRRFRPQHATVGLIGGMIFPQTQRALPLNTYSAGLSGEFAFGRHIRLCGSAEYLPTQFRVTALSQFEFNIPPLTPPTPDDILHHVQVNQPLWDFSLGLRYVIIPEKRLHPFASASWVGEQTLEQTLQYEFKNQLTEDETYIRTPRSASPFNASGLRLGMGAEWIFAKHLSLQLEGLYQRQFSATGPLLVERLGVKGGIAYRF